jgi:hypothetical protein
MFFFGGTEGRVGEEEEWGNLVVKVVFFLAVLGFELKAFILSHSTIPIFVMGFFKIGSGKLICPDWL